MSYSLSIRARCASIATLMAAAAEQFDEDVVRQQPCHKADRAVALANLEAHAKLVGEPPQGMLLAASMHGSIGGDFDWSAGEVRKLTTAGSGCSVWHTPASEPQA